MQPLNPESHSWLHAIAIVTDSSNGSHICQLVIMSLATHFGHSYYSSSLEVIRVTARSSGSITTPAWRSLGSRPQPGGHQGHGPRPQRLLGDVRPNIKIPSRLIHICIRYQTDTCHLIHQSTYFTCTCSPPYFTCVLHMWSTCTSHVSALTSLPKPTQIPCKIPFHFSYSVEVHQIHSLPTEGTLHVSYP